MVDLPFGRGIERSRHHGALLVGDVAVIVLLLSAGMVRHNENPLVMPERAVLVVGPYLLGWVVAAALAGTYTSRASDSGADSVANVVGTWFVATLVGSTLRGTQFFPGHAPLTFVVVVGGLGAVALAIWRGLVTVAVGSAGR